jgi:catechol 2,3-dioxygenase-like lactoylglutathione lyase family enzyme
MQQNGVHELRLVVTTEDYDRALHFYRDVPGSRSGQRLLPQGGTSRSLRPAEQHWS